ncbi:S-methyl-5-thioribose kinase [Mesorhizobium sp. 113-3-3]|uniref:S-methyl-5-thioribose kinase n=1 Tax=Mesorhizobium sp. 113-3-3 TaxID=2744516 RepID=UPI001925D585|nr:S-methyl-5-thioribose kinase [Mesorhizobium sp. 113-3-3]BCG81769.1 methylthioribose kinase [Mesorhizobium sp. 113-3-3]
MTGKLPFEALSAETLATRLGTNEALCARIGRDTTHWKVREVGDGNLNLVFIVEGASGAAVVKQALPYVRLVGDSWPLPLKRSFFEYHALTRQEARAPGSVPAIYHFDEGQALIIMEYLAPPHVILRRALIEGRQLPNIARDIGLFMARTLFRGSDLSMVTKDRKADLALFADNVELCDITENLVFSDPYFDAKMNRHTPQLDSVVAELRADRDLKVEAQRLKHIFAANAETLLHGDLHSGSIMVTDSETRMIDPEFAFYGPMAFDVGMLLANFWMSFFSQRGHEEKGKRDAMRAYLLGVTAETWAVFRAEFSHLWRSERTGMLYQKSLFEDQGDRLGAEQALDHVLHQIWTDLLGFAGIEVHRRILGLAHNADFETIADEELRASYEAKALKFGRHIAVNRRQIHSIDEVNTLAALIEQESSI